MIISWQHVFTLSICSSSRFTWRRFLGRSECIIPEGLIRAPGSWSQSIATMRKDKRMRRKKWSNPVYISLGWFCFHVTLVCFCARFVLVSCSRTLFTPRWNECQYKRNQDKLFSLVTQRSVSLRALWNEYCNLHMTLTIFRVKSTCVYGYRSTLITLMKTQSPFGLSISLIVS